MSTLEADVRSLRSDQKQLKEMQESILRTQQQLLYRMKRLEENVVRGSWVNRHQLQHPDRHAKPDKVPVESTQATSSSFCTSTPVLSSVAPTPFTAYSPSISFSCTATSSFVALHSTPTAVSSHIFACEDPFIPHLPSPSTSSAAPLHSVGVLSAPSVTPSRPLQGHNQSSLPSSTTVQRQKLVHPEEVITKYPKLLVTNKAPTLAMKLAREAFFGEELMARCTVMGCREYPALPSNELCHLKETLYQKFPAFWNNAPEFEAVWASCVDAIGQACKRLRHKQA